MMMAWKNKLEPGKKITKIAGAIDLLPTLADLAGVEINTRKPLDGISVKPLLFDSNNDWEDRIIYNYWGGKTSLRNQKFRLDFQNKLYDMDVITSYSIHYTKLYDLYNCRSEIILCKKGC